MCVFSYNKNESSISVNVSCIYKNATYIYNLHQGQKVILFHFFFGNLISSVNTHALATLGFNSLAAVILITFMTLMCTGFG